MFACVPPREDYRIYALAQMRELIDRYAPSVIWNDIAWPDKRDVPGLLADYYAAAPDGVVNDRWFGERAFFDSLRDTQTRAAFNTRMKAAIVASGGNMASGAPPHCDFRTVEYGLGEVAAGQKWEACRGIGLAFGYNQNETDADHLDHAGFTALRDEVLAKGGNLLINIGPMADGRVPDAQRLALTGA